MSLFLRSLTNVAVFAGCNCIASVDFTFATAIITTVAAFALPEQGAIWIRFN